MWNTFRNNGWVEDQHLAWKQFRTEEDKKRKLGGRKNKLSLYRLLLIKQIPELLITQLLFFFLMYPWMKSAERFALRAGLPSPNSIEPINIPLCAMTLTMLGFSFCTMPRETKNTLHALPYNYTIISARMLFYQQWMLSWELEISN